MWKATWNVYWGTRRQDTFVTLYYNRKPTNEEIFKSFRNKGHRLHEEFYLCSGMITVSKIEVEKI